MMCSFTIPADFPYQYILIEGAKAGITGATLPYFIIYGTYWVKTPVDPTLTQAGEAADAKTVGDLIGEGYSTTNYVKDKNISSTGELIDEIGTNVSDFIPYKLDSIKSSFPLKAHQSSISK